MCDFPNPKPAALTWMIDRVRGTEEANSIEVTCESYTNETEFEAEFFNPNSGRWVGECDDGDCFVKSRPNQYGGGCSPRLASSSHLESKHFEQSVDNMTTPDAGSDAEVDGNVADGSLANDAGVSADANTVNDGAAVNSDAAGQADDAQVNADMSIAAEAGVAADAALEPDAAIVPPPPLDLESITFGIEPDSDCLLLAQPGPISSCMDIASAQAFDVSRLFTSDAQPVAQPIEDVQLLIDDNDNNPNNANQNYPRNLNSINRADRLRYIRFVPVDVGPDYGLWDIEVHDEFIQHPEDNTVETPGNIRAGRERCVNGDCSPGMYSYTVHIAVNGIINGALTSCSWQYPKPEGSLCGR